MRLGARGDADAVAMTKWLLRREGLFVGGSAGANVLAAARYGLHLKSRQKRHGDTGRRPAVLTLLCDGGVMYAATLHSEEWLAEKGQELVAAARAGTAGDDHVSFIREPADDFVIVDCDTQ
mmetsp:Transcript_10913/g.26379  ORF Transcript_10913/g.26379 Transcript_10913/m.26379 type:complete len:121 (+) Transcript_10913:336-698(+)